jgi:hypothetical protein
MDSNIMRVVAGIAVVVVAVVLLIVLGDDGESDRGNGAANAPAKSGKDGASSGKEKSPVVPVIVIEGGEPVGGVKELGFDEGDRIRFRVESDVGDEIHVHGYDIARDVEAGGSVTFDFPATIEGVFEAELEERKQPIAELTVNP